MMAAMVGVLWCYNGWVNLTPLAEEIRDADRNIPRALILGMGTLIALYVAMTLAYHLVLPLSDVAASSADQGAAHAVAAAYCRRLLGREGVVAIALLVMGSTFISLNASALCGPRAYFAMARDGLFPSWLSRVHRKFRTPAHAVVAQGGWAIVLTVAGTLLILAPEPGPAMPAVIRPVFAKLHETPLYTLLYTYVVFGASVFSMLATASVFVLRARRPDLPRPYRTWGYPLTPALHVVASLLLLAEMMRRMPAESLAGVVIIGLGVPVYGFFAGRPSVYDESHHVVQVNGSA
jgi:amino acid transporter